MGRPVKQHKAVNLKMEIVLYDRLSQYCEKSGLTKTKVLEKALEAYLNECEWMEQAIKKRKRL